MPELNLSLYEFYHLNNEAYTFDQGAFGTFPIIGPIPAENTEIATAPDFTTYLTATVAQPISQLYKISLLVKQRELQKALSDQNLRARVNDVSDEVKKQYYQILKTQSSHEATLEKIVFLSSLLELVERDVAVGRLLEKDSLEVKARLSRAEYEKLKQENSLETEKERFNRLLGRDVEMPFAVAEVPYAAPFVVDVREAEETALAHRPEIQAAEIRVEFSENEVKLKKSEYIPDVGVELSYTANFNIELLPEHIATIGLFAKWDIFDWGKRGKEVSEKKLELTKARNRLSDTKSEIIIEVNKKIRELEEAAVYIDVTRQEQIAAKENLRVVMNKYRVEDALLQHVLEAESSLGEKNSDHEKAILEYWTARAELERAIGEN